jgi:tRNA(Ile2) C34 agmatinyltransferase TiaS
MEKLSQILKDLEQGKISADHAEAQILDLFVVTKSVCENCKEPVNSTIEYRCENCKTSVISEHKDLQP